MNIEEKIQMAKAEGKSYIILLELDDNKISELIDEGYHVDEKYRYTKEGKEVHYIVSWIEEKTVANFFKKISVSSRRIQKEDYDDIDDFLYRAALAASQGQKYIKWYGELSRGLLNWLNGKGFICEKKEYPPINPRESGWELYEIRWE